MRIYNATRAQIEMPLSNGTKLVISSNTVSGEFMPNSTIISVFMSTYKTSEIAFVVSGPYEIAMLSNFVGSGEYVVSSVEEAVARFAPKGDPTTTPVPATSTTSTTTYSPAAEEKTSTTTTMKPVVEEKTIEATTEEPKKKVVVTPKKATTTETPSKEA